MSGFFFEEAAVILWYHFCVIGSYFLKKPMQSEGQHHSLEENREAHFSGLSPLSDVQQRFDRLRGKFEIVNKKGGITLWEIPTSEEVRTVTSGEMREYQEDFAQDVLALRRRLQRLKIRVLEHLLVGTKNERTEGLSYADQKKTPMGRLRDQWPVAMSNARRVPESEFPKLISALNQNLPANARLTLNANLRPKDLMELRELSFALSYGAPPAQKEAERLERYLDALNGLEDLMAQTRTQGHLFPQRSNTPVSEDLYHRAWTDYRDLVREIATDEELTSWYSPTYGSSGKGQRGKDQRSEKFRSDYQRFKMPEMVWLEGQLQREYVFPGEKAPLKARSFLFNSGQAAMDAVIRSISSQIERERMDSVTDTDPRPIMFGANVYFETEPMFRDFAYDRHLNVIEMDADTDAQAWTRRIVEELPHVVFLVPMGIDLEMRVTPLVKIFQNLSSLSHDEQGRIRDNMRKHREHNPQIHLVIDNTSLSQLARWKDYIDKLPAFFQVHIVESLVKYAQDGQEISQAGLATVVSPNSLSGSHGDELWELQSKKGYRPPESVTRRLEAVPPQEDIEEKLLRHSRNAIMLARAISENLYEGDYLTEVIYPGLEKHPDHKMLDEEAQGAAGLFTIRIGPDNLEGYVEHEEGWWRSHALDKYAGEDLANQFAHAFEAMVLRLAKEAGVEINSGTSYGFSTTRIAIYGQETDRWPYVRIAVGTENTKNVLLIAEVLKRANEIFSRIWQGRRVKKFTREFLDRNSALEISEDGKTP